MVTNVNAKSNYDWLHNDKALGFQKYGNKNKKSKYNVCIDTKILQLGTVM